MSVNFIFLFFVIQEFQIPGANVSLKVMFIDTVLLAGLTDPHVRSRLPYGPESFKMADDQWAWISSTLEEFSKTGGWTIVVGHYPGTHKHTYMYVHMHIFTYFLSLDILLNFFLVYIKFSKFKI